MTKWHNQPGGRSARKALMEVVLLANFFGGLATIGLVAVSRSHAAAMRPKERPSREQADTDFKARCSAPGVVRCIGFDSSSSVLAHVEPNADKSAYPAVDNAVSASGGGSLKFTVPSLSSANSSGLYWTEFADDLSVQFGAGQEFYVQWRQRFSPEMLQVFAGGGGWKQAIIGEGSRPGHTAYSCTAIELTVQDTYQGGGPRMYHSCGEKDNQYEGLDRWDRVINNVDVQPGRHCDRTTFNPPCVRYVANQWMTFQLHVKVGTWYANNSHAYKHDSTVQLWVAQEGKPSILTIDLSPAGDKACDGQMASIPGDCRTGYDLTNPDPAHIKYGKIWLLPYDTGKDATVSQPVAYTWYDELIISRQRIADPQ